jgi:hypothetical protein
MTQASTHPAPGGTRLVRLLRDLQVADAEVSHQHFAGRLARLIDLADSINIADAHGQLRAMAFEPTTASNAAIKQQFLRSRTAMMQAVIKGLDPQAGPARSKLPTPETPPSPLDKTAAAEPYLKFYATQQGQIDANVQRLQKRVREAVAGLSPKLAQLCALDTALGDTLAVHSRKFFAVIPRLLQQYFEQQLQAEPEQWRRFHQQLCARIQGLLLAEIEVRLEPVLGLIEATNEHSDKTQYE